VTTSLARRPEILRWVLSGRTLRLGSGRVLLLIRPHPNLATVADGKRLNALAIDEETAPVGRADLHGVHCRTRQPRDQACVWSRLLR
jgi:hypothetical protein